MQNNGGWIQGHWRAGHPLYGWLYGWIVGFLLPVAKNGYTWKEKIVGFLHDAIEDTDYTTEALFMDISRIPSPTPKDYERLERYKSEYKVLLDMLPPIDLSVNLE